MKLKLPLALLASIFACLTATRADLIYLEKFNYTNGYIVTTSGGVWARQNGSGNDAFVINQKLEISASSPGTLPRTDDVHRDFPVAYTNKQIVYASFIVNCTNLPPAVGTYFAHFDVNNTTFHCRIYAQAGTLTNTWRLGVAGVAGTVNQVYPVDLATNTDYQVVVQWDPVTTFAATLWVNPISSGDLNIISGDPVTAPGAAAAFGTRQAGSFGSFFCTISNLAVATTFTEAATNTLATNATAPTIAYQLKGKTNFVGDPLNLSIVASGQGIGGFAYQWRKGGGNVANPNGNTNVYSVPSASLGDSGNYDVIVTSPNGLSTTSVVAVVSIVNSPNPPTITQNPPTNNPVFYHQTAVLSVTANGPPPLSYQWYKEGSAISDTSNFLGTGTPTLSISDVFTNNNTTGAYFVVVGNLNGSVTSSVANVTVSGPPAVSISFLRTLVDGNYIATNSNARWQATGIITTFTNLTSGNTASYYLQDATAGINIFVTLGQTFRPMLGDVVTFTGFLSSFNSTLELTASPSDPTTSFVVLSNNIAALPAPKVIPFSITNDIALVETNIEGSIVMLTNVFFGTNAGTVISTNANVTVTVTNASGEAFTVFFSPQDLDTGLQTLPSFAWSVIGPLTQNLGNAITPRNAGYSVTVTRFADIVTNAPPAAVLSASRSGNSTTIRWTAVPYSYSYSVLSSTNVAGPYLRAAGGLTFTNTTGSYTDTNNTSQKYYRVTTP